MKTAFSTALLTIFILFQAINLTAQTNILIKPFLQDMEPTSGYIVWETSIGDESKVQWGLTEALGNETIGTAFPSNNGAEMIHQVQLVNLDRFTRYYYKVITDDAESEVHHFKTPPFASDNEPFRIVAMSDMQRDGSHPDKFQEIVEDGVLSYLEETLGEELVDNLALVMIPGDLVVNGNNFDSWKSTFFGPAENLISKVPVYPVPGNHENDAQYFFSYFKLPDNGTEGFKEHWWHKDYGNVRLVGMDSNGPYQIEEQLNWLEELLDNTCAEDSIDFVFAQLHHPHKSELWTPGNTDFTGEVIELLENFTTDCNKPSIHFFGHTHGYSRGQSRDHKHLWINVATAGGAIDNWGEFPNFDYEEFSVSQDEYGFVVLEITGDDNPQITIKRISRGDQDTTLDNVMTDELTMRVNGPIVEVPNVIYPVFVEIAPDCVVLKANDFSSSDEAAEHGQSHWQIDLEGNDFSEPIIDSWKNFENWYNEEDTQAGDDLTDEEIMSLESSTSYQWRVRYRDREMNWSDWSPVGTFSTKASLYSNNLLVNAGAEDDLENWITVQGIVESVESEVCDGIMPFAGSKYFAVGGICESSAVGIATQDIDVTMYSDSISTGSFLVNFGGYLTNFSGSDQPEMKLFYLDQEGAELGKTETLTTLNSSWTLLEGTDLIPLETKTIRVELKGTRNAGTDNDSYFDDIFVKLGPEVDCGNISSVFEPTNIADLKIFPNPASSQTKIAIPSAFGKESKLYITNEARKKISPPFVMENDFFIIDTQKLSSGMYNIHLRTKSGLAGSGKLVVAR